MDVDHILNSTGILKNFSISKSISKKELDKLKKEVSEISENPSEFDVLLKEYILTYADEYIKRHKVPGLIFKDPPQTTKKFKVKNNKLLSLYKEAVVHSEKLKLEKKLSKYEIIFYILSMVGHLKLSQTDFEKFNEELTNNEDFDPSSDDDGLDFGFGGDEN